MLFIKNQYVVLNKSLEAFQPFKSALRNGSLFHPHFSLFFFMISAQEEFKPGCFLSIKTLFTFFSIPLSLYIKFSLSPPLLLALFIICLSLFIHIPTNPVFSAAHTVYCFLTQVISCEWWHLKSCWDSFTYPECLLQNVFLCLHSCIQTHIHTLETKQKHTCCHIQCTHTLICTQQLIPRTAPHTQAHTCRHLKQINQSENVDLLHVYD